jgi:hypothetical protein
MRFSVGTHNLYDDNGTVTLFASLIVYTEAVPSKVFAKVAAALSRTKARLAGYRVAVCRAQPDLVIAYRRSVFKRDLRRKRHYRRYVDGVAKVTPNRGTFSLPLIHRETGRTLWVNAEHRINAAFPPYVRGEPTFRREMWERHTAGTLATMHGQASRGHLVVSAGDCNTPREEQAYPGFHESGEHFDRIGSTASLSKAEVLSTAGSDHHRRRAILVER